MTPTVLLRFLQRSAGQIGALTLRQHTSGKGFGLGDTAWQALSSLRARGSGRVEFDTARIVCHATLQGGGHVRTLPGLYGDSLLRSRVDFRGCAPSSSSLM